MALLKGSRTDQSLRHALSGARRLSRLSPSCTRGIVTDPRHERATPLRLRAGHLDFLIAGYDTSGQLIKNGRRTGHYRRGDDR
jgi:hypothetical protein